MMILINRHGLQDVFNLKHKHTLAERLHGSNKHMDPIQWHLYQRNIGEKFTTIGTVTVIDLLPMHEPCYSDRSTWDV